MRTFRMIGMALTATLMCVSLTSCEPNDDNPAENSTSTSSSDNKDESNTKRLAMVMEYKIEDGRKVLQESYEFVYNDNGKVTEIHEGWSSGGSWQTDITKHTWDGSKSFTTPWDDPGEYSEYLIDNGRISKELYYYYEEVEETYYYNYNKGHIKECGGIYEEEREKHTTFSWNDEQLSMTVELIDDGEGSNSFIYSNDQTCKGFFPLLSWLLEDFAENDIFVAHPELVGIKTTHLPSEMIEKDCTTTFEYEFDTEGYIVGCFTKEDYTLSSRNNYYTFSWE